IEDTEAGRAEILELNDTRIINVGLGQTPGLLRIGSKLIPVPAAQPEPGLVQQRGSKGVSKDPRPRLRERRMIPLVGCSRRAVKAERIERHPIDTKSQQILAGRVEIHPAVVLDARVVVRLCRLQKSRVRDPVKAATDAIRGARLAEGRIANAERSRHWRSQIQTAGGIAALCRRKADVCTRS